MMRKLRRSEEGSTLVMAMLVCSVILVLGTMIVELAMHNSTASSYDRRRVQSIAAAEAGVDYYFSQLAATGGNNPPCSVANTMAGSPGGFQVTATFYDKLGNPLTCPIGSEVPDAVLVSSVGRSTVSSDTRTMQAYARLVGATGGTFDNSGAIFGHQNVTFTANATIGGEAYSDADLYSNGNVVLASNSTMYGNIYAQGSVTVSSNADVRKSIWSVGNISLSSGARVRSTAMSSGGSIALANNARIYGGAKAAGAISGGFVDNYRSPNQAGLPTPPTRPYPVFSYVPGDWTAAGYTVQTFTDCNTAETFLKTGWTSGDVVIRITSPTCELAIDGGPINVKGNLAIIADGPVSLATNVRFVPSPSGTPRDMFLFAGLSGTPPCSLTLNSNSGFNPGLMTFLYVPQTCSVELKSNTGLAEGQLFGGNVSFKHTASFRYKRLAVPGTGVAGYKQDVVYKREVVD